MQNLDRQKKDGNNDVIKKYLQKLDDQRGRLLILCEKDIENYKTLKKSYANEKIDVETELGVNG